jgi:hydroxypyruvate reductase
LNALMDKPEIVFLGTGPDWYMDRFAQRFTLHVAPGGDAARLSPEVAGRVEALVSAAPVGQAVLDALPRLRLIANPGVGYEKIDTRAAAARGIELTNTPVVTNGCVADMAFALLLALGRHILQGDRHVRSGRWPEQAYPLVPRVHGRRMGIVGLGEIGMAIARRAEGFDMPVAYHNRRARPDVVYRYYPTLLELAAESDILVVACPGGAATRHLVDAGVLKALGPRGMVVNISRGTVIDESALIAALRDGTIAGAGLDVFEHEPAVPASLRELSNVVLMPHRGGGTFETWEEAADVAIENLEAFFAGKPLLTPVRI